MTEENKIEVPNWMREMPPFVLGLLKSGVCDAYNSTGKLAHENTEEMDAKSKDEMDIMDIIRRAWPYLEEEFDKLFAAIAIVEKERKQNGRQEET